MTQLCVVMMFAVMAVTNSVSRKHALMQHHVAQPARALMYAVIVHVSL
jgi:hypothetical protein